MVEKNIYDLAYPKLTESQLKALDKFAVLKSFQDGEILFEAGESAFKFFVIKTAK